MSRHLADAAGSGAVRPARHLHLRLPPRRSCRRWSRARPTTSPSPYELLRVLSLDAGRVVTFDTLLRWVWAKGGNADAKLVHIFVRTLCHKLGDSAASPATSSTGAASATGWRGRLTAEVCAGPRRAGRATLDAVGVRFNRPGGSAARRTTILRRPSPARRRAGRRHGPTGTRHGRAAGRGSRQSPQGGNQE